MRRIVLVVFFLTSLSQVFAMKYTGDVETQPSKKEVVSYSLVSSKLTLHEPVIMNFTISNTFAEPITVDLGADRKEGFRFTVTRPDGVSVQLPPLSREGIFEWGKTLIKPGQSYSQHLLVNEWFEFSVPGLYAIEVLLANPVRNQKGGTVLGGTKFRAGLEVMPRDAEKLRSVCESLFQQMITSKSYGQAAEATSVLSYVKDPVAVPYLEKVIRSGRLVELIAIAGLRRIGDRVAVQALISILNSQKRETAQLAGSALARIEYSTQDPALKEMIRRALR